MVACNVVHVITVGLLMIILWHAPQALWAILAVLVLHGGARSFFHPAGQAILPNLMPRAQFANAVAYSSSALKLAQLVGPALGRALIPWAADGVSQGILALVALPGAAPDFIAARLDV